MIINKELYESNIKKMSKLINHLDLFFEKKEYNKKDFITNFSKKINNDIGIKLNNKRTANLLFSYHKYNNHFDKVNI